MNNLTEFEMENEQDISGKPKTLALSVSLPTKDAIYQAAMNISEQVKNGEYNPIEMAVKLSALEKMIELIRAEIAENVLTELDKENGKATMLGAKVIRKEVGTSYDYSGTPIIAELKEKEKAIADKRKAIEKTSQILPDGTVTMLVDEATGETHQIVKAAKSSKTSFAITLSDE